MGSSSTKTKEKENNNLVKQPVQVIQAKPYEFKKDELMNKQNQAQANNSTYNQQNCNIYRIEPMNNLLTSKKMQQNINLIQPIQKQTIQNYCEYPKINLLPHPNSKYQSLEQNLCNFEQHYILQRKDKQNIDSEVSKDGFGNINRNLQFGRQQQRWDIDITNQTQQQDLQYNYQHAEEISFQNNNQHIQDRAKSLLPPTLQQIQQQRKNQEMKPKPMEINQILEKGKVDYIEIYNQIFNTQTQGKFSNKLPCKHSKCQTVAHLNAKGEVGCKNGCHSYPIDKAIFNNKKNTIFRCNQNKQYDVNQYNQIIDQTQLAKILGDSLLYSNKRQSEKNQFSLKFMDVITKYVLNKVRQNNQ